MAPQGKVCLLGRRVGALVAATYASDPVRAANVSSTFLLEPVRASSLVTRLPLSLALRAQSSDSRWHGCEKTSESSRGQADLCGVRCAV